MVELFAVRCLGGSPDGSGPVARVATLRAPHAGQGWTSLRDFHPNCPR